MGIVVSQLISAAMLQDFIIGKNALPLASGVITMYQDSNHTTLKNWYYQTGTPGNYSYAALPNPMVLSAAGTMIDVDGNDIIPFYYPFVDPIPDEEVSSTPQPYFVTVYDQYGTLQFTRSNFPFIGTEITPSVAIINTNENYIINNRFWRNANIVDEGGNGTLPNTWTTQYNSTGTVYYQTLAPDQHDGFSMPDFNYVKNVNGSANETITFNTFPKQQIPLISPTLNGTGDIQPEFYINHTCLADTSGASLKAYQFPISLHQATLACQNFTFTIEGKVNSGNGTIEIFIYQFCGTGVPSPAPKSIGTITFNTTWQKSEITDAFNPTLGLTLGSDGTGGNDDAYYLQINMPTGSVDGICNIDFCLPSIYLSGENQSPTNSFSTYDQIDSVVSSPRTGDVRMSVNTFQPFGWVPMNDGVIAKVGTVSGVPIAYQGYDAWSLYNLLWTQFSPYSLNGTRLLPIYTSTGSSTTYGASAYADWNALKQIQLTAMMGRVILGTVPISSLIAATPTMTGYQSVVTASSSSGLLFTTTAANLLNLFTGNTVTFTGTAALVNVTANTIYYIIKITTTTFKIAISFANAVAGTPVGYTGVESGTVTAYLQLTGSQEGEYAHTQLNSEVGSHLHPPLSPATTFLENAGGGNALSGAGTFLGVATTGLNQAANVVVAANVTQPASFYNAYIKL